MKKLTLQITKENFNTILNGTQKVEHRYIYPSNASRYIYYKHAGKIYKKDDEIPEDDQPIEVIPVKYDVLYLINGRRKDAPRLTVEVEKAEFIVCTDENGNDVVYTENGVDYLVCQVWYHLGKVLSTENVK